MPLHRRAERVRRLVLLRGLEPERRIELDLVDLLAVRRRHDREPLQVMVERIVDRVLPRDGRLLVLGRIAEREEERDMVELDLLDVLLVDHLRLREVATDLVLLEGDRGVRFDLCLVLRRRWTAHGLALGHDRERARLQRRVHVAIATSEHLVVDPELREIARLKLRLDGRCGRGLATLRRQRRLGDDLRERVALDALVW